MPRLRLEHKNTSTCLVSPQGLPHVRHNVNHIKTHATYQISRSPLSPQLLDHRTWPSQR